MLAAPRRGIAISGVPFLLPTLYQIGLGASPSQVGLLIVPQPVAAMSLRLVMPRLLRRLGYRRVLLSNTLRSAPSSPSSRDIGPGISVWEIVAQAFAFGFFSSFQYI